MKLDIRKYRSRDAFDNARYSLALSVIVVLGGSISGQLWIEHGSATSKAKTDCEIMPSSPSEVVRLLACRMQSSVLVIDKHGAWHESVAKSISPVGWRRLVGISR